MVDVEFIEQLVDSINEAVLQMENAIINEEKERTHKLRVFIFGLHNQIDAIIGGENV